MDNDMKKPVFSGLCAVVFCLGALGAAPARAQEATLQEDVLPPVNYVLEKRKPEPTAPSYIYMIFSKLAGSDPDYEAIARNTQVYQDAIVSERPAVLDNLVLDLKSTYSLLTLQEAFIMEVPVALSPYSAVNKGFFIQNFREDTFFPVAYNDQSYAIIPQGIMDKQWLMVPDPEQGRAIENAARNSAGKPLTMQLMLIPKYADKSAPVVLAEQNYWLIGAEIKSMSLYAPDSPTPLWQSDNTRVDNVKRQELLDLRK